MRDQLIKLITQIPDGINIKEFEIELFAEKLSVSRSEFYGAYGIGITPKWIFSVNPDDYQLSRKITLAGEECQAQFLEHDGVRYTIIRDFCKNPETCEITVR